LGGGVGAVVFSLIILGTKLNKRKEKEKNKQTNKRTKTGPCE
jgi:hypothetical protein